MEASLLPWPLLIAAIPDILCCTMLGSAAKAAQIVLLIAGTDTSMANRIWAVVIP